MLEIINELSPFFEDCYRRINVREYAKLIKKSPPTASSILNKYHKLGLLEKQQDRIYLFFYANKNNKDLIDLSKIYWRHKLNKLILKIKENTINPTIILFGSLSKAEVTQASDVDIAIISNKKDINIKQIELELSRKIELFWFKSLKEINNELLINIINGYVLEGRLKNGLEWM